MFPLFSPSSYSQIVSLIFAASSNSRAFAALLERGISFIYSSVIKLTCGVATYVTPLLVTLNCEHSLPCKIQWQHILNVQCTTHARVSASWGLGWHARILIRLTYASHRDVPQAQRELPFWYEERRRLAYPSLILGSSSPWRRTARPRNPSPRTHRPIIYAAKFCQVCDLRSKPITPQHLYSVTATVEIGTANECSRWHPIDDSSWCCCLCTQVSCARGAGNGGRVHTKVRRQTR